MHPSQACEPGSSVGIATGSGWTVRGSNPGGGEIFRSCPDRPWRPPCLSTMGTGSFPGVKCGRGVTLTLHPLLVPWSRKSRGILLDPLWAVRPVQKCKGAVYLYLYLPCLLRVQSIFAALLSHTDRLQPLPFNNSFPAPLGLNILLLTFHSVIV